MTTAQESFSRIKEIGIVPAIRPGRSEQAVHAAGAILDGGVPILEISLSVSHAFDSIAAVRASFGPRILVGAGTVVDAESVYSAHDAGAQFIVTSGFGSEIVQAAQKLNLPILVGALTPTEVQIAFASRADAIKLFPCYAVGGPRYFRSLRGQYPEAEFVASGGISLENCTDYLRAGACAIGVGGEIGDAESIAAGDHRLFTERAKRFRKAVTEARLMFNGARPR